MIPVVSLVQDPGFKWKSRVLLALVVADLLCASVVEPLNFTWLIISLITSVIIQFLQPIFILALLWDTTWLNHGLIGLASQKISIYLLTLPFHMTLTAAVNILRLEYSSRIPMDIWSDTTFQILTVVQKLCAVIYASITFRTALSLGDPEMFRIDDDLLKKASQRGKQWCF